MDLQGADDSERRFSAYILALASVIGNADRVGPLRDFLRMTAGARDRDAWLTPGTDPFPSVSRSG